MYLQKKSIPLLLTFFFFLIYLFSVCLPSSPFTWTFWKWKTVQWYSPLGILNSIVLIYSVANRLLSRILSHCRHFSFVPQGTGLSSSSSEPRRHRAMKQEGRWRGLWRGVWRITKTTSGPDPRLRFWMTSLNLHMFEKIENLEVAEVEYPVY